jgi:hypothetical protein
MMEIVGGGERKCGIRKKIIGSNEHQYQNDFFTYKIHTMVTRTQ